MQIMYNGVVLQITALKTQIWGKIAKVGSKRKRKSNSGVKTQRKKIPTKALPTWDKDKFYTLAIDRGYVSKRSIVRLVAETLGYADSGAEMMISTGRFRWEQILCLGSVLEMTPKEFCDIFLRGYFKENNQGRFICQVDDIEQMLKPPKVRIKSKIEEIEIDEENESEDW